MLYGREITDAGLFFLLASYLLTFNGIYLRQVRKTPFWYRLPVVSLLDRIRRHRSACAGSNVNDVYKQQCGVCCGIECARMSSQGSNLLDGDLSMLGLKVEGVFAFVNERVTDMSAKLLATL